MERSAIRDQFVSLRDRPRISRSLSSGAHSRDPLAPSGLQHQLANSTVLNSAGKITSSNSTSSE
jgi:hypothetical protein